MSSVKSNPEGLKVVECERGVGGKNAPIRYIPEQDPVQDALEKTKKTTYFKLTLPNTGSELKVAIWASGTPEQFLLHVRTAMHVCKQLGLETEEADAMMALEAAYCKLDAAKAEYTKLYKEAKQKARDKDENPATDSRKKAKDPRDKTDNSAPDVTAETIALGAAKKAREEAQKKVEEAAQVVAAAGAKPFELYANLLADEARQPWEKILKAQVTQAPWEDIYGTPQTETPTKSWSSFRECVKFHLQTVFRFDAGEALKYYITNTLKKPNRVSIRQFFVRVEQLNSYLETLPCLFYSPKANPTTKEVLPLDDADLATHLLRMCPARWQAQYDLSENTTPVSTRALLLVLENIENNADLDPKTSSSKGAEGKRKMESIDSRIPKKPKKVGWTDKHCVLCKKHGGPFKSHNTRDCRRFNKDGTPIKNRGGASKPQASKKGPEGANFAQLVRAEIKKAFRKHARKDKKRRARDADSNSNSDNST